MCKYLKACRILSRDVVVRKKVSELKDDETKKLFQQGGCLVISLDSLLGESFGGRDSIDPVRVQIIRHARTHSVGKYQSCMFEHAGLIVHAPGAFTGGSRLPALDERAEELGCA